MFQVAVTGEAVACPGIKSTIFNSDHELLVEKSVNAFILEIHLFLVSAYDCFAWMSVCAWRPEEELELQMFLRHHMGAVHQALVLCKNSEWFNHRVFSPAPSVHLKSGDSSILISQHHSENWTLPWIYVAGKQFELSKWPTVTSMPWNLLYLFVLPTYNTFPAITTESTCVLVILLTPVSKWLIRIHVRSQAVLAHTFNTST